MKITVICLITLISSATWLTASPVEIRIDSDKKFQTWEGSGSCLSGYGEAYAANKFVKTFTDDLGMNVLRVDLSPIVLGESGRHTYSQVEFSMDPHKNMKFFHYDNNNNTRMTSFSDAVRDLSKANPDLIVILSVWTPPHWMKNGSNLINFDNDSAKGTLKMDDKTLEQFSYYLVAAVKAFEKASGRPVNYLSIQNEPLFEMDFNSCKYSPQDYAKVLGVVAKEFKRTGMTTQFFGPESVIYGSVKDPFLMDQQIEYCKEISKNPDADEAIVAFAAHGYGGDGINSDKKESGQWDYYWSKVESMKKRSWQTETGGGPLESALKNFPAAIIEGMISGNVSMWVTWQVTDNSSVVTEHTLTTKDLEGNNAKFAVAKQFFRFIRPGAVRLGTTPDIIPSELAVTAWQHEKNGTLTVEIFNPGADKEITVVLPFSAPKSFQVYQTTSSSIFEKKPDVLVQGNVVNLGTIPAGAFVTLTNEK